MMSPVAASSLCLWILLSCFPGSLLSATVTLESISIFETHEWFKVKPIVYFQCKGENFTVLPDVKEVRVIYMFKGQESWQPLTNLSSEKCKRCGFYEKDTVSTDDVFDEWELCPSDFSGSDGKYTRINEKEFNATFLCPECVQHSANTSAAAAAPTTHKDKGMHVALIIVISVVVSAIFIVCLAVAYKYWLRMRREQEQARFLKLFEDGDDIEDELELSSV